MYTHTNIHTDIYIYIYIYDEILITIVERKYSIRSSRILRRNY